MERARVAAAVVSLALIGATLEPLVRGPHDDGFPLSTYPMFATERPTTQTVYYVLGETTSGERRTLSPAVIGTGEILQAFKIVEHAIGRGRAELAGFCAQIATRVAADDALADVGAVLIVAGTHDAVEYLAHGRVGPEVELSRCPVVRR